MGTRANSRIGNAVGMGHPNVFQCIQVGRKMEGGCAKSRTVDAITMRLRRPGVLERIQVGRRMVLRFFHPSVLDPGTFHIHSRIEETASHGGGKIMVFAGNGLHRVSSIALHDCFMHQKLT
jgi:hypothetical protein